MLERKKGEGVVCSELEGEGKEQRQIIGLSGKKNRPFKTNLISRTGS